MRRISIAVALLVAIVPSIASAQEDVCSKLIDHGLNNIALRTSSQSFTDRLYWRFCDEKYESMSDSKKVEFGVTIKSIPMNLGLDSAEASQKHAKFCGDYRTATDRNSQEAVYTNVMHDKAIDAWRSCIEVTRKQMFIDFRIPPNQKYVDIAMKYTGPASPINFNGVETTAFTCTMNGQPVGPASVVQLGSSEKQLRCERQGMVQTIGGVNSTFYGDAGITVKSDAGNGSVDFISMIDGPARSRFEQVDVKIGQVQANVDSLSQRLAAWSPEDLRGNPSGGGGDYKGATVCPTGSYVTGVEWWGAPHSTKFCIGCLSSMRVLCRPLNR